MKLNKTFHFLSGLPRSGSSLLANLLFQNPRFHVTPTSGVCDLIFGIRNQFNNLVEFQANPNEEAQKQVMRGILKNFYADIEKPVIFDKSRAWLAYLEMVEMILERPAKVLVPVRDVRDVLASFEKLWRAGSATRQIAQERENYFQWQTVEGRCEVWASSDQPVGLAFNRIQDAISRGFRDRLHFVRYEDLTRRPLSVVAKIYEFLEEAFFEHDFQNVEQTVVEKHDEIYGLGGELHKIRPKIEAQEPQWLNILGEAVGRKYQGIELW